MARESCTYRHESADILEDIPTAQKAVPQTFVQKVVVPRKNVVDGRRFSKISLQLNPVWLEHLEHHVILKVLDKVEHSLKQGKRGAIPARTK